MLGENTHTHMALSEMSYGSQKVMCMSSAVPNLKQLGGGPTNSDLAFTDILLFANMKILLTETFQVTAKIKS
jgi:hypothetical protein